MHSLLNRSNTESIFSVFPQLTFVCSICRAKLEAKTIAQHYKDKHPLCVLNVIIQTQTDEQKDRMKSLMLELSQTQLELRYLRRKFPEIKNSLIDLELQLEKLQRESQSLRRILIEQDARIGDNTNMMS
jgi:predicted nuclease with TOPRIM domain